MPKNFDAMTTDELVAYKLERKGKITALQEEIDEANVVYTHRVQEMHEQEALKQLTIAAEREGKTLDEMAQIWLEDDQPGHTVQAKLYMGQPGKVN